VTVLVPKASPRRKLLMASALYHAGAAPHLFASMPRAVIVPVGAPERFVKKRTKQELKAARAEEKR
jgi:hypothetical protein